MINVLTGKRYVLLAVVTLGVSACSALGTSVAEDDPETEVPNGSLGRAIMEGLGAVPSRQTAINYTPRAPLVVPPGKTALVAPEDANRVDNLANWPEDNDLKTRKMLAEADARDAARGTNAQNSPSELMALRVPDSRQAEAKPYRASNGDSARMMPSELGNNMPRLAKNGGLYDADGKPVRKALVEPPVAYLEPAPGAPVTTEDGSDPLKKKKSWWKFW